MSDTKIKRRGAEFTAGPWTVNGPDDEPYGPILVVAQKWHTIAKLGQDDAPVPDYNREQWQNARLIAAAPDLYEALWRIKYRLEEWVGGVESKQDEDILKLVNSALSKSDGHVWS